MQFLSLNETKYQGSGLDRLRATIWHAAMKPNGKKMGLTELSVIRLRQTQIIFAFILKSWRTIFGEGIKLNPAECFQMQKTNKWSRQGCSIDDPSRQDRSSGQLFSLRLRSLFRADDERFQPPCTPWLVG